MPSFRAMFQHASRYHVKSHRHCDAPARRGVPLWTTPNQTQISSKLSNFRFVSATVIRWQMRAYIPMGMLDAWHISLALITLMCDCADSVVQACRVQGAGSVAWHISSFPWDDA
jgi:hypothetical protein